MGSFSPRKPLPFQPLHDRNTKLNLTTSRGRHFSDTDLNLKTSADRYVFIYQEVEIFRQYSQQIDPCLFEEKSIDLIKRLKESSPLIDLLVQGQTSQARSYIKTGSKMVLINCHKRTKHGHHKSLNDFFNDGKEPDIFGPLTPSNDLGSLPECPLELLEWVMDKRHVRLESNLAPELTELLLSFPLFERQILILSHATTLTTQEIADLLGVNYNKVNNTRARKIDPVIERWRSSLTKANDDKSQR